MVGDDRQRLNPRLAGHAQQWTELGRIVKIKVADEYRHIFGVGHQFVAVLNHFGCEQGHFIKCTGHVFAFDLAAAPRADFQMAEFTQEIEHLTQNACHFVVITDRLGDLGDLLLALQGGRHSFQFVDNNFHALFEMLAYQHRVTAGSNIAHALVKNRLEKDGCGSRAIAGFFVLLPQDMPHKHRSHILVPVW